MYLRPTILAAIVGLACFAGFGFAADPSWKDLNLKVMELYLDGKDPEATKIAQNSVQQAEREFGKDHAFVASSWNDLGELYRAQGKFSEAEDAYKKSIVLLEKVSGTEKLVIIYPMAGLAEIYLSQERYAEAELIYQRLISIIEKSPKRDKELLSYSYSQLALISTKQGKYSQAGEFTTKAASTRVNEGLIAKFANPGGGGHSHSGGGGGGGSWVGPVVNTIMSVGNALSQINAQAAYEQSRALERAEAEADRILSSGDEADDDSAREPAVSTTRSTYSPPVDKDKFRVMVEQAKKKYEAQETRKPIVTPINTEEIKKRQNQASQILASVASSSAKPPVQTPSDESKRKVDAQTLLSSLSATTKQQPTTEAGKDKRQQQAQILLSRTTPDQHEFDLEKEWSFSGQKSIVLEHTPETYLKQSEFMGVYTDRFGRVWEPNEQTIEKLRNLKTLVVYEPYTGLTKDLLRKNVAEVWNERGKHFDRWEKERDNQIARKKEKIQEAMAEGAKAEYINLLQRELKRLEKDKSKILKAKEQAYNDMRHDMNIIDNTGDIWKVAGGTKPSDGVVSGSSGGGISPPPLPPTPGGSTPPGPDGPKKPPGKVSTGSDKPSGGGPSEPNTKVSSGSVGPQVFPPVSGAGVVGPPTDTSQTLPPTGSTSSGPPSGSTSGNYETEEVKRIFEEINRNLNPPKLSKEQLAAEKARIEGDYENKIKAIKDRGKEKANVITSKIDKTTDVLRQARDELKNINEKIIQEKAQIADLKSQIENLQDSSRFDKTGQTLSKIRPLEEALTVLEHQLAQHEKEKQGFDMVIAKGLVLEQTLREELGDLEKWEARQIHEAHIRKELALDRLNRG